MAADNVLKEFLVSLGFQVDEAKHALFQRSLKTTTEEVNKLGLAITSVSLALAAGFERIADQFQSLYYTSQLTGQTIQNLKDLQFAAGQTGVSADAMSAALRNAQVLLQTPGGEAQIRAFTGYRGAIKDSTQAVDILLKHWHYMFTHGQQFMARLEEQMLLFNTAAMEPLILNWDRFAKAQGDLDERAKALGLDLGQLGRNSVEFGNQLSRLWSEIGLLADKAVADWIGPVTNGLKGVNDWLTKLAGEFAHLDLGTRRWVEFGGAVAAVGGGLAAVLTTLRGLRSLLGLGGAAAGAGAAGGAAAGAGAAGAGGAGAAAGAAKAPSFFGALLPFLFGAELANEATSGPGSKEWADKVNKQHREFWRNLWNGLLHRESYQPGAGEGASGLLRRAAFRTSGYGDDASQSALDDLRDWLHGSSSFVPMVRAIDAGALGFTSASYTTGGVGAGGGNRAPLGPSGPLAPGGAVPRFRAALAQRLYAHARSLGLDKEHALAMLGNALAESGLDPNRVGDNGTSFGLFQEHNDRMTAMLRALGQRANDPIAQFDFAYWEQMQRDPGWFKRHTDANDFERSFERPAHLTDRSPFADAISRALGAIGDTRLGGDVHHHGDKNITVNAGQTINVNGAPDGASIGLMQNAHNRVLGDAVRRLTPLLA